MNHHGKQINHILIECSFCRAGYDFGGQQLGITNVSLMRTYYSGHSTGLSLASLSISINENGTFSCKHELQSKWKAMTRNSF